MKKRVIAVDIDEVLAAHNIALVAYHNARYGSRHTLKDYVTEHWSQVWGTDREETNRRAIEFHESGAHARLAVVTGSLEALNHLKSRFDLIAVTVRRRMIVESTRHWIDKNFPGIFQDIRFVHAWDDPDAPSKAEVCAEINAEWLIDDSIKHCGLMAETGRIGIVFGDYPWNQMDELPEGVIRLKDWEEVRVYFDAVQ